MSYERNKNIFVRFLKEIALSLNLINPFTKQK